MATYTYSNYSCLIYLYPWDYIGQVSSDMHSVTYANLESNWILYDITPIITSISPSTVPAQPVSITITGHGFGDNPTVSLQCTAVSVHLPVGSVQFDGSGNQYFTVDLPLDATFANQTFGLVVTSNGENMHFFLPGGDPFVPGLTSKPQSAPAQLGVGAAPVTASISRNSSTVSGNDDLHPVPVSVGDAVTLTGAVTNLPSGVSVVSQSWSVGGTSVSSYTQSLTNGSFTLFTNPGTSGVTFYRIDSDNVTLYPVTYAANLSNQTMATATALFKVARPTPYSFSGATSTMTPVVNVGNLGLAGNDQSGNPIPTLNFGYNPQLNNGAPGITVNMQESSGYGGQFALIQLVRVANPFTLASSGHTGNENSGGVYVLDTNPGNTFPQYDDSAGIVPTQAGNSTPWSLVDVPFVGLTSNYSSVTANESFQTYFMYQPPTPGAIWVTLAVLNWSWGGTTTVSGGLWAPASATSFSPNPAGATTTGTNSNILPKWSTNVLMLAIH